MMYKYFFFRLLPPKLMRDWTSLFVSGVPLYETVIETSGEPTPEQILEEVMFSPCTFCENCTIIIPTLNSYYCL